MSKTPIKKIEIHIVKDTNFYQKRKEINKIHVEIIKRELNNLNISKDKKLEVLEDIIQSLKSREKNGIIK